MRVVITGASGQLGSDLRELLAQEQKLEVYPFSRQELDITKQTLIEKLIRDIKPDIILHCAAYTNVDECQLDPSLAFTVNALGSRNIAVEANKYGSKLVYVSTDYVFDGKANIPYHEFSQTNPLSIYGQSKLAGEEMVRHLCNRFFILRTSWLYGISGNNFVKTILRIAQGKDQLTVVDDQIGCPTYSKDLAKFIIELMSTEAFGLYHVSNTGYCSWFEFACAILDLYGLKDKEVKPIKTAELNRPAPRPNYSGLTSLTISSAGLSSLPHWKDSLCHFISELKKEG